MPYLKHIIILLFATLLYQGTVLAKKNQQILLTIDGKPISKEEFVRIYEKNNKNLFDSSSILSPKEYLELFINFKLKVHEAESLGMDTTKAFKDELGKYRADLAAKYLTDISYNEKMDEEMYRRMNLEVNASHILISLDKDAIGQDTLQAYNKIVSIRKKIVDEGADFEQMAEQFSNDPSAKANKGKLGYFTAFQMVYPFENAAYSTPIGEVSQPVRSAFGYHLVKVNDIRKAQGKIKVAHIMKSFPKEYVSGMREKLKQEIDSLYQLLQNGHDFAQLAKDGSDDIRSAQKGGELPWFTASNMISDFSQAAFALKNNGDYSAPVLTSFGYHIIKRLDYQPIPPFEEVKSQIESNILRDADRTNQNKEAFISKLKKEYLFTPNEKNMELLVNHPENADTSQSELFILDNKPFTTQSFVSYLAAKNTQIRLIDNKEKINLEINNWIENEITGYEDSRLADKYPDFKYLVQEYHDGILLFNLSEKKIWDFASADTAGLETYYEQNLGKYTWGERFKGLVISCKNQQTRDQVDAYFDNQVPYPEILDVMNANEELVTITEGAWEQHDNPIVDYYVWGMDKPNGLDEQLVYVRGDKTSGQAKTLQEARGLYVSDYQNFLEKKWIEELRDKYQVKVNKRILKTIKGI